MTVRLGPAAPAAGSPESEALRRFRSFLCASLVRGSAQTPALDGLRLNERRVMALIGTWRDAAIATASEGPGQASGSGAPDLGAVIDPFVQHFRVTIRGSTGGRTKAGRPRATRRAVAAAIDRVADAFLAIDTDSGEIVDANPAAGALLGVERDALLGVDALSFVPQSGHAGWWIQLDAMSEDGDTRNFDAPMVDASGCGVDVDARVTRFATRGRVLALVMMRPRAFATPAQPAPALAPS